MTVQMALVKAMKLFTMAEKTDERSFEAMRCC